MKIDMFTGTTTFEKSSNEVKPTVNELDNIFKDYGLFTNDMICISPESGELHIEEVDGNTISFKISNVDSNTISLTKEQVATLAKFLFLLAGGLPYES